MVERDLQDFLQRGSFPTSRAKSPIRSSSDAHNYSRTRTSAPVRANQSSKLDPYAPRTFNLGLHKSRFPPPPSVEDEVASLAREHGSSVVSAEEEQAKFPGDPEQFPIIQEVYDYNPERRFVIVPNANAGSSVASDTVGTDDEGDKGRKRREPRERELNDGREPREDYEANTCRKYVVVPSDDESNAKSGRNSSRRPNLEKRKSRQDLPRIETDVGQDAPAAPAKGRDRRKSTTERPPRDYFGPREPSKPNGDDLLSPVITSKHSTKGRDHDRAYYEDGGLNRSVSRNRGPSADRRGPSVDEKRRGDGHRGTHSLDPPVHKRTNSTTDSPKFERRTVDRTTAPLRNREDAVPRGPRYPSPPRNRRRDSSPAARERRKSNSPPYPPSARESKGKLPGRSPSFKGRRERAVDSDYSEDEHAARFQRSNRRPPQIHQDEPNYLLSPDQVRPPAYPKPRSRDTTPLASPRTEQAPFHAPELGQGSSPRSATFPTYRDTRRVDERPVPPLAPSMSNPQPPTSRVADHHDGASRVSQSRSRASSVVGTAAAAAAAMAIPILSRGGNSTPVDSRRPPTPPPHGSPPRRQQWQPPPFNPTEHRATLDQPPVLSYRRHSQDVQQGTTPAFAECPRIAPVSGHFDWLTIPQARGFVICPTCYESTFGNTQFRHSFVPAPMMGNRPLSCDFGSSHWYRVAWLMTLKNGYPDLRLFHNIAAVDTKQQECSGRAEDSRIWYSIMDPRRRRPVQSLTVCPHCAKTIEAILPSLFGVFVALDAPAVPTRGVCHMHFAPGRQRFLKLFDLMENTSDLAVARKTTIDQQALADRVRDITLTPECRGGIPAYGQKWHVMESLPDFTVCEECFDEVVLPILESDRSSRVARNFYKRPQLLDKAECQLYSKRMRNVFKKACEQDSLNYLNEVLQERLDIKRSIDARLDERPGEGERGELLKEWAKWE